MIPVLLPRLKPGNRLFWHGHLDSSVCERRLPNPFSPFLLFALCPVSPAGEPPPHFDSACIWAIVD